MTQDELKALVAKSAVEEILQTTRTSDLIGMGTGSTVNFLIYVLAEHSFHFSGVVSSSEATSLRLRSHGFEVVEANAVSGLPIYIDGADEINSFGQMIKGGGGALTREKIVAALAQRFICICDASKLVDVLGQFPLPIEIIPMARAQITRFLEQLGGQVTLRLAAKPIDQPFVTDNAGWILDVRGLQIMDPAALEAELNQIPGIICNGIFAQHSADVLLISGDNQVRRLTF
jgi:ribose 5-phosphate isomerase A